MTGKSVLACLLHHEDRADVNYHKMKETRNETIMPIPKGRGTANVHFGEKLKEGRIDQKPPGTVRYGVTPIRLGGQRGKCELFAAKEMMDD